MVKCCQCAKLAMWASSEGLPLCLDCFSKYSQIVQTQIENHERAADYALDEMAAAVGMPRMGPRFSPRPQPIHIAGVQMHNITVSNSVVGTINTGSIGVVDQSISALVQLQEPQLAEALKQLSQAILSSADLTANQKTELFESLSVVSSEAATPKPQRRNSMAVALIKGAAEITSLANDITDICQKWWPVLLVAFQAANT